MTKFFLGLAVGYVCSDIIDELLGKLKKDVDEKVKEDSAKMPIHPDGVEG